MTTVAAAQAVIRSLLETQLPALSFKWQNEKFIVPNTPAPFAHVELIVEGMEIIAFGGGRGANLQRTIGRIEAQVMVAANTAVATGLATAEDIAAVFRGYRDADISCFACEVFPETGATIDGNYAHVATTIVDLHFDKTG
jgi:hypothetical protein